MEILNNAINDFNESVRQRKADHAANLRRIFKDHPEINDLRAQINKLWVECVAGKINKPDCEKQTEKIYKKIENLLQKAGYSKDVLEYSPLCKDCMDTGYVASKMCHCLKLAYINKSNQASALQKVLAAENYGSFNSRIFSDKPIDGKISAREAIESNLSKSKKFIQEFDGTDQNLLFIGPTGTGKTFLAHCIANELINQGKTVVMLTAHRLIENLTDADFERIDRQTSAVLWECDLLIIDDLGCERKTDYAQGQLFNIINDRIASGKKMIVSTNLSAAELGRVYAQRIFSRLIGAFSGYIFPGEDLRLRKKKNITDNIG